MATDSSKYNYSKGDDSTKTILIIGLLLLLIMVVGGVLIYIITSKGAPYVPPAANVEIKVIYDATTVIDLFNSGSLVLRFIGQTSGASAVSEHTQQINVDTVAQIDLGISSVSGTFAQSELVRGQYTYTTGKYLYLYATLISYLASITVTDGGLNYNVRRRKLQQQSNEQLSSLLCDLCDSA